MTPRRTLAWTMIATLAALPLAAPAFASHHDGDKNDEKAADSDGNGWLGVRLQRVDGGLAEALDLDEDSGVLIGQVLGDSPAEKAGLESGDIVTKVDDKKVGTPTELRDAIARKNAGDKVTVHYLRDKREKSARVTLGEAPEPHGFAAGPIDRARRGMERVRDLRFSGKHGFLGVMTQDLDGDLGAYFGAKDGGALVTEVVEDSPAEKLGLRAGDVIVEVDGTEVEDAADLRSVVGKHDEADEVQVVWLRDKKRQNGKVALEVKEGMGIFGMGDGPHAFAWRGDDLDIPRLRDHLDGTHRVLVERFGDDGELRETIEKLRAELDQLREEVEELKSD